MATKLDNKFTPGGRLVMGSLTSKQDKDFDGKPIPPDQQRYFFGLAVPKNAPGVGELIGELYQMAVTDYAHAPAVMAQIQQGLAAKDFAWKISDGDVQTYDKKTGQMRPIPEYLKGCYIFKFSTQFEVDACDVNGITINRADVKIGDYADIMFSSQVNGKMDDTAGIYLNPQAIRRLGFGDAIASGISAADAFKGRAAAVPQGATTMPTAGANAVPPPGAGNGMPGAQGGGQTAPANGMPGMPGATSQTASHTEPHTAILQGPSGGGMPGMPGT